MSVVSGVQGIVKPGSVVGPCLEWKIRTADIAQDYVASNTQEGVTRQCGHNDWRGRYRALGAEPLLFPGDTFQFEGTHNSSFNEGAYTGADGGICERITIIWDIEAGKPIEHTVDFASNGTLTLGTMPPLSEPTMTSAPECSIGKLLKLDDTEQEQVRYIRLSFWTRNKPYGTSAAIQRVRGPLDAELFYRQYIGDDDAADQNTAANIETHRGSIYNVKVDATDASATFWNVEAMRVEEIRDFGPDINGAENVGADITARFAAFGTVIGSIYKPSDVGTALWPF